MYLTRINPKTGLVDIGGTQDGVMAIKEFRELINAKEFGLEAFTCVALTMDHLTPHRNYAYIERHKKAMRNVTGDASKYPWKNDLIQAALQKYEFLQYNQELEELKEYDGMQHRKFEEVRTEADDVKKLHLMMELQKIKRARKAFSDGVDQAALLDDAPSKGDYNLSRLEQKLSNKKSFYYVRKKVERPKQIEGVESGNK